MKIVLPAVLLVLAGITVAAFTTHAGQTPLEAQFVSYDNEAYCADDKTDARVYFPITDEEYTRRLEPDFVKFTGFHCTTAIRTPIYNTTSGKLEKGYYIKNGADFLNPIFSEYTDATGTHEIISGFLETDTAPTDITATAVIN